MGLLRRLSSIALPGYMDEMREDIAEIQRYIKPTHGAREEINRRVSIQVAETGEATSEDFHRISGQVRRSRGQ